MRRLLSLAILLMLLSACAVNPVTGQSELMLVTEEMEVSIGQEAAPSLLWSYGGEFNDQELSTYLDGVVRNIWAVSERPHLPVRFVVQNTSLPNAFALPGYVAITRGLLAEMDNEAQFAAVMGHEVGHVMARHTAKRMTYQILQGVGMAIGSIALEDNQYRDVLLGAGAIGSQLLMFKFSRDQELQSDGLGVKYMAQLGYDPNEAIAAHVSLERSVDKYLERIGQTRSSSNFIEDLLSTHPRHEVRVEEMRALINSTPQQGAETHAERFVMASAHLREAHEAYAPYDRAELAYAKGDMKDAMREVQAALSRMPEEPTFLAFKGMVELNFQRYSDANDSFSQALAHDPQFQPAIYGLGVVELKSGSKPRAMELFGQSMELFPEHAPSFYGYGKAAYDSRNYEAAIGALEPYASADPEHPDVHGMLAMSYEKTGRVQEALEQYQLQVQVAPDSDLGRTASKRIKALTPKQPSPPGGTKKY